MTVWRTDKKLLKALKRYKDWATITTIDLGCYPGHTAALPMARLPGLRALL